MAAPGESLAYLFLLLLQPEKLGASGGFPGSDPAYPVLGVDGVGDVDPTGLVSLAVCCKAKPEHGQEKFRFRPTGVRVSCSEGYAV